MNVCVMDNEGECLPLFSKGPWCQLWHLVFSVLSCPEGILWLMHMDQPLQKPDHELPSSVVPVTANLGPGQCPSLPWFPPAQTVPGTASELGHSKVLPCQMAGG